MTTLTLIVNTMPTGRAEDGPAGKGDILVDRNPDPTDQPDRALDSEARRKFQWPKKLWQRHKTRLW